MRLSDMCLAEGLRAEPGCTARACDDFISELLLWTGRAEASVARLSDSDATAAIMRQATRLTFGGAQDGAALARSFGSRMAIASRPVRTAELSRENSSIPTLLEGRVGFAREPVTTLILTPAICSTGPGSYLLVRAMANASAQHAFGVARVDMPNVVAWLARPSERAMPAWPMRCIPQQLGRTRAPGHRRTKQKVSCSPKKSRGGCDENLAVHIVS